VASKQRRRKSSGSAAARSRRRTGVEQRLDYRDAPLIPDSVLNGTWSRDASALRWQRGAAVAGAALLALVKLRP